MATVTCPACGKSTGAHFAKCVHCNAPTPVEPGATAPAPPPTPVVAAKAPLPAVSPAAPPKPSCPCCGEAPGPGKIRVETREYKGATWTLKRRYLVRTVDVPGVCARCMKGLTIKRLIADALVPLPFIVFFILLVGTESKLYFGLFLAYALVLFKWSWGLTYVWADALLYGGQLNYALALHVPPGDAGTTRFPAGLWHGLLRLVGLPVLGVILVLILGLFVKHSPDGKAGAHAEGTHNGNPQTYLRHARDIAVPVDRESRAMKRDDVNRTDIFFFTVYVKPATPPAGTDYLLMTGPQLLDSFLRTSGTDNDLIFFTGDGPSAIRRREAAALAPKLPRPGPLPTAVQHSP